MTKSQKSKVKMDKSQMQTKSNDHTPLPHDVAGCFLPRQIFAFHPPPHPLRLNHRRPMHRKVIIATC